jgi:para-nitrobenzyl esterase
MKKIGILCIALVLALALVIPSAAYAGNSPPFVPEPPPGVAPIIFVHGGAGSAQQFESQAMRFASNGWPDDYLFTFEYTGTVPFVEPLLAMLARLDAFVGSVLAQTGADKVYLMGHSLGTAVSQAYLAWPPYAAKVAKYVNIDGGTADALPGGVPTLALWAGAGWSYNPLNEIVGATNIHLTDQTHVQTATSPEAFAAMFEFFTGEPPATTDIIPQPPGEVELAGRAVFFPANQGVGNATLEIWEVDGATGARKYDEPEAIYTLSGTGYYDGTWGPFEANGLKHYEIVLLREGARAHHFYFEPFMRSNYFVRLQTSQAGGIGDQMERDLNSSALVITRQKEFWGDQGADNDVLTINSVNIINAATCPLIKIPGFTGVVGIFAYDRFLNGITDLSAPIPYFFGVAFMTGVDICVPAADPPDGTTSLVLTPRGGGGLTQVINIPNWASLTHSVSVVFNDYVQDIDTYKEYIKAYHQLVWKGKSLVTTQYGKVRGAEAEGNTFVWKGIPYAQPPVDELRWKAPQDPEPWDGILEAGEDPERCLQPATAQTWHPLGYNVGSEDCLYLNIWRPQTEETDLPVYFWIHGGSNNFGGCEDYNGAAIANRSNMVVVVIQYRLGPFGWFNHPALYDGDPKDDSGNFGTLDCIKALEWVRDNIAAFGGDPDNVTVAGESAGAHNTMSLVISPLASGLFHRAVSESGGMQIVTVEHGIGMANATIDNLLVADGTCATLEDAAAYRAAMSDAEIEAYLRAKPGEDILNAQLVGTEETHNAYADGYVIPGGFVETIESGDYNHVPIILGSNEYETKDFIPLFAPLLGKPNWSYVYDLFDPDFHPGEWTFEDIFPTAADTIIYEACGYYGALNWKAHYVDEIARPLQEQQDDVYAYLFQWGGPGSGPVPFDFVFGAAHAMEIPFFWGADESLFGYSFTEDNRLGREELQSDMMAYIANFAATGDPNGSGLYEWEEWSNDEGEAKCIQFDATYTEADISMMDWEITSADVAAEVATLPYWVQPYVWGLLWP